MVRGLRAYSDFEYEFQLALANRKLAPETETLFMMPKEVHSYVTSSMVRDIARLGGDPSEFVPPLVAQALAAKYASSGRPQ
jgi:pantetheine-phosphate adenylyltransferase